VESPGNEKENRRSLRCNLNAVNSCWYQANYTKTISIVQVYRLQLYIIYYTIKFIV